MCLAVIRFEDDIVEVGVEHLPTHSGRIPISALLDDVLGVASQIAAVWGEGVVSLHFIRSVSWRSRLEVARMGAYIVAEFDGRVVGAGVRLWRRPLR